MSRRFLASYLSPTPFAFRVRACHVSVSALLALFSQIHTSRVCEMYSTHIRIYINLTHFNNLFSIILSCAGPLSQSPRNHRRVEPRPQSSQRQR